MVLLASRKAGDVSPLDRAEWAFLPSMTDDGRDSLGGVAPARGFYETLIRIPADESRSFSTQSVRDDRVRFVRRLGLLFTGGKG